MNQRYAGLGVRFVSAVIDFILLSISYIILIYLLGRIGINSILAPLLAPLFLSMQLVFFLGDPISVSFSYFNLCSSVVDGYGLQGFITVCITERLGLLMFIIISILILITGYYVFFQKKYGQTIGKKIMKIKVVDIDGKTPTKSDFFLREIILKPISAIILGIGYLSVIWNPKRQSLHDKLAETYVIHLGGAKYEQTVPQPISTVTPEKFPHKINLITLLVNFFISIVISISIT